MSDASGRAKSWLRRRLGRFGPARSARALSRSAREAGRDSAWFARRRFDEVYLSGPDAWGYASTAEEQERYAKAMDLIDRSVGEYPPSALEVGCGEGLFTSQLLTKCSSVLAVDFSEVALSRARRRCAGKPHVSFARWDVRAEPPLGQFQLVVCMDVIDEIHRPLAQRKAAKTVARSVAAGGSLLVTAVIQDSVIEHARWARFIGRGGRWVIDHFASRPNLTRVELCQTERHLIALYRASAPQ